MLGFIATHSDVINAIANVAIVLIWVVYLQLFLVTLRRQRRSAIRIDRGVASDEHARCIVTNMGQEPVYLLAIVADFGDAAHCARAVVTDRDELADKEVSVELERTNQGPLSQGQALDVGSLADLLQRARARLDVKIEQAEIERMSVTAVAISNEAAHLVAAQKTFAADHRQDGRVLFTPETVLTRQVRSRWKRRDLLAFLENRDEV